MGRLARVSAIALALLLGFTGAMQIQARQTPGPTHDVHRHSPSVQMGDYYDCSSNPSAANCDNMPVDLTQSCMNPTGLVERRTHSGANGNTILVEQGYETTQGCRVVWTQATNTNPDPNGHYILAVVERNKDYGTGQTQNAFKTLQSYGNSSTTGTLYCFHSQGDNCQMHFRSGVDSYVLPFTQWYDGPYS